MGSRTCATVALALLGSGCAQLFGIDTTTGGGGDAHPTVVSMQVQRITVGPTVTRTPEDVSGLTASYFVDDATDPSGIRRVPATVSPTAPDTWTADIPTGDPPIEVALGADYPDKFRRLYAFPQRTMKLLYGIYEDPNPVVPVAGSTIKATITLPTAIAAGEAFQLYSMGAWAYHPFSAAELGMATTQISAVIPYDTTAFSSTSGRPIRKIGTADQVLALRYVTNYDLTGSAEFTPFSLVDGGQAAIAATMAANPHAALDVHLAPATTASRLAKPAPAGVTVAMAWSVNAAPGYEIANSTGPMLQHGDVLATDTGVITAMFGNPFTSKGWHSTFLWSSNKSRTYTIPSLNVPATLYTGINDIDEVAPGLTFDAEAPIPVLVSINQMPLTTDGNTIPLAASKSVELTMVADKTDALFYQWNVYEVRANAANTAAELHVAYVALATEPKVTLPNDVFVAGKTYQIRAHCVKGGYPSFAEGNLWNRSLPYSVGFLDAGIFTVTAQ